MSSQKIPHSHSWDVGCGPSSQDGCLLVSAVVLFLCPAAQLGVDHSLGLVGCCVLEWDGVGRKCVLSFNNLWGMVQL